MPISRCVVAERLDHLRPSDPAARHARRDLRRVNVLMGNAPILASMLLRHAAGPPARLLEIGAGDGATSLALARRLSRRWRGVRLTLVDAQDLLPPDREDAFVALGWTVEPVVADVFDFLGQANRRFDAVIANLFLHHFDERLAELLEALARAAPLVVAAEPRRSRTALAASRLLGGIGANAVTRHDAPASVRAGFTGGELGALFPHGTVLEEGPAAGFTHRFAARAGP